MAGILNLLKDMSPGSELPARFSDLNPGEKIILAGSVIFALGIPWNHVAAYVGMAVALTGAVIAGGLFRFGKNEKSLLIAMALFFAWGVALSLAVASRPSNGLETVFMYLSHWMIPFAIGFRIPAKYKKAAVILWLLSLFILGAVSLLAFIGLFDAPRLSKQGMLFGLHNHIQFAALMLLGFNILYGLFLAPAVSRNRTVLNGVLCGLFLIWFILAGSRGWWIAAMISVAGMTIHHIIAGRNRKTAAIIAALGILMAAGSVALVPQVRHRIENTNFNDPNYIHRRNMAVMAWEIVKENPFLGIGPGQTPFAGEYYDRMEARNLPQETGYLQKKHFHNIYLQMTAEFGIPGLLLFLIIVFYGFRILYVSAKNSSTRHESGIVYGVLWSFVALVVAELFDCLLRGPAVAMEFFWALGICAGLGYQESNIGDISVMKQEMR